MNDDDERQHSLFELFPPPDLNIPGKVGRGHPDTSREAAYLCRPNFGTERAKVLIAVALADDYGATAAEVARAINGTRNQIATRLGELREQDWILRDVDYFDENGEPQYRLRATGPSTHGIVHILNPAARSAFDDWAESLTADTPNP